MSSPLEVDYYSDVLCVWAWIAQRRIDEIHESWGDAVRMRFRFVNVFGDAVNHIDKRWADRGGAAGFAKHVRASAAPYESAPVNPSIWRDIQPRTSVTAHLVLKAAELTTTVKDAAKLAVLVRSGFFVDALDVGSLKTVLEIADQAGFDTTVLMSAVESGQAQAALMADYEQSQRLNIQGSPSWVLNNGRQILYGNVGYRVLNANIAELAKSPGEEASWC